MVFFYTQSAMKGYIRAKQNAEAYHKQNSDSLLKLKTHSTIEDLENMKLNEPGRQKLGRYGSPVSRHSIQSYILTYYRL